MSAPTQPLGRATHRTVVLLRDADRKKLDKLAARENVSSGEIIRRSLNSYESIEARIRKEEEEKFLIGMLNVLSESLEATNQSVAETCDQLDRLHLELKKRDIR